MNGCRFRASIVKSITFTKVENQGEKSMQRNKLSKATFSTSKFPAMKSAHPKASQNKQRTLAMLLVLLSCVLALQAKPAYALNTCYAIADTGNALVSLDKVSGKVTFIGTTGRDEIESATFKPGSELLYVVDKNELGTLSLISGIFTSVGTIGTGTGNIGTVTFNDIDGLAWDTSQNVLYAVLRHEGPDLLFQIDPTTGSRIAGAFNGADYVQIGVTTVGEGNVDDLTFDPLDGTLFGLANKGGTGGTLITINKSTGTINEIGPLIEQKNGQDTENTVDDMEGLSFFNDGALYGSTGDSGPDVQDHNKLYQIDKTTGKTTFIADFLNNTDLVASGLLYRSWAQLLSDTAINRLGDFEGLACLTANIADDDQDGLVNSGEDANGNGTLLDDDTDSDGTPNYLDNDDDGDTILTINEDPNQDNNVVNDDIDNDGIPNYLDNDDDNDGILSKDEDTNADGDPRNDDADNDGVADYLEPNNADLDKDGTVNQLDDDDDGDGIPTKTEGGTDEDSDSKPNYLDLNSDGDTIPDSGEWSVDANDPLEGCTSTDSICFNNDADGDTIPNFLDKDSDGDGLSDGLELPGDLDGDGIPNWLDASTQLPTIYLPLISKN